jgi:hypothetical protein
VTKTEVRFTTEDVGIGQNDRPMTVVGKQQDLCRPCLPAIEGFEAEGGIEAEAMTVGVGHVDKASKVNGIEDCMEQNKLWTLGRQG